VCTPPNKVVWEEMPEKWRGRQSRAGVKVWGAQVVASRRSEGKRKSNMQKRVCGKKMVQNVPR